VDGYMVTGWAGPSMGGRLQVSVAATPERADEAAFCTRRVGRRVNAWADRLTRFSDESDLMRLNNDPANVTRVRPTLGAVLEWARRARDQAPALLDVTLLDARLSAELGTGDTRIGGNPDVGNAGAGQSWTVTRTGRGALVDRPAGTRFDLDGVAKGWLADRACELLLDWPGSFVDADGDLALAASAGVEWLVEVADPRAADASLATLRVAGASWRRRVGIATSGTSVHRWLQADGSWTHHLVDPLTGRPALTDVVQATVVAPTAREAEVLAKAAVILGSEQAAGFLEQSAAQAAVLLPESGEVMATPDTRAWLA
jgi:thiamine biosynthesis lipoprotein